MIHLENLVPMKKNKVSILVPFNTMKDKIQQKERWIREDWTTTDKYVIMADERYCTPCLLLVYKDTDNYIIFHPTYKDYALKWSKKINA